MVRHGNTELNYKDILQGHIDSPLTERGYKDAEFIAEKLNKTKFDAVFSSDLGRAFITAHIITDNLKLTDKLFRVKEFREIDYGKLTGKLKSDVLSLYNEIKNNSKIKVPGGESHLDVKKRVIKKVLEISKEKYKTILIVTHNNCIRSIMSEALNKNLNLFLRKKISHRFIARFEVKNKKVINFKVINE